MCVLARTYFLPVVEKRSKGLFFFFSFIEIELPAASILLAHVFAEKMFLVLALSCLWWNHGKSKTLQLLLVASVKS